MPGKAAASSAARRWAITGAGSSQPSRAHASRAASPSSGDLAKPARLDLVDEAADRVLSRDERARLDAGDRLAHVLVEVVERLGGPLWLDAGLSLDLTLELVVGEGEHAAVGVVDEDDLLGAE